MNRSVFLRSTLVFALLVCTSASHARTTRLVSAPSPQSSGTRIVLQSGLDDAASLAVVVEGRTFVAGDLANPKVRLLLASLVAEMRRARASTAEAEAPGPGLSRTSNTLNGGRRGAL